jgi:hypothetical protein
MPGSGAVTPSFGNLQPGTNYQLQVSIDLTAWRNSGSLFAATNYTMAYPQSFDVSNCGALFFRVQVSPWRLWNRTLGPSPKPTCYELC